jgi:hypothetical protein
MIVTPRTPHLATSRRGERVQFGGQNLPHEHGQIVREICVRFRVRMGSCFAAIPRLITDNQTTETGHRQRGVSDPSGHARGHFQRAHRGRSRHGFLP